MNDQGLAVTSHHNQPFYPPTPPRASFTTGGTGLEPDWTYLGTMFTTQFMSITLIILIVLLMHSSSLNAGFGDQ